jgi:DNA (cytosine-5)-methyltransferase 1
MYKNEHKFPYRWTKKDANFTKDKGKVMSCFCCGGGSSFGYKLAGYDVVACNEIDPKVMKMYLKNHDVKYSFNCDIRELDGLINQTEKPVKLMEILIRNSTNVGDVVLDPFMGSGTTARACVNLERKYIGFEIDQRQVDFANNELKNMSRQLSLF